MIDYKKIKAIAWDFDDTLFAHANHKTETEKEEIDYIKNCLLYANNENIDYSEIFSECRANVFLERFMNRAYNNLINNQVPLVSSNIVEDQTPFIVEHWNTGSNAISFSYGASRTTDIPLDINKKIVNELSFYLYRSN